MTFIRTPEKKKKKKKKKASLLTIDGHPNASEQKCVARWLKFCGSLSRNHEMKCNRLSMVRRKLDFSQIHLIGSYPNRPIIGADLGYISKQRNLTVSGSVRRF